MIFYNFDPATTGKLANEALINRFHIYYLFY